MRRSTRFVFAVALVAAFALFTASAAEATKPVTLSGQIGCEMCVFKAKGATSCNNVFVAGDKGKEVTYKLASTDAVKPFMHQACESAVKVKITGTVSEKDGAKTIAAEKIEKI